MLRACGSGGVRSFESLLLPILSAHSVFAFANYMYNENGQNQFEVGVTMGNSTNDLQNLYASGEQACTPYSRSSHGTRSLSFAAPVVASLGLGVTAADVIQGLNDGSEYSVVAA